VPDAAKGEKGWIRIKIKRAIREDVRRCASLLIFAAAIRDGMFFEIFIEAMYTKNFFAETVFINKTEFIHNNYITSTYL
jgi:hypothetical protein